MCSGMLYRDSPDNSVALSRELANGDGSEAAEELTASTGEAAGVVADVLMEEGPEDAKRTPAPFRIKTFVLEN